MNISIDNDLTIKVSGVPAEKVKHAIDRLDNYYDGNGLFLIETEEHDGEFMVETMWTADCTLPKPETLKEQFSEWIKNA